MAPVYKLFYFPARMRCEFIRYIFAYTNTPYEEVTINFEEWLGGMKEKMPMKSLPVLELANGRQLSQSLTIARFLGTKLGLASDDPFENAWGDQLVSAIEDIYPVYYANYVRAFLSGDQEKKSVTLQELKEKGFEPLLCRLDKFLGDKKYFCSEKVHWVDVVIAEFINRIECSFDKNLLSKHPNIVAHSKRIHENPGVAKRAATRNPAINNAL